MHKSSALIRLYPCIYERMRMFPIRVINARKSADSLCLPGVCAAGSAGWRALDACAPPALQRAHRLHYAAEGG